MGGSLEPHANEPDSDQIHGWGGKGLVGGRTQVRSLKPRFCGSLALSGGAGSEGGQAEPGGAEFQKLPAVDSSAFRQALR